MTCARGCSGVSLCATLQLCCIRLRGDCGTGCTGLPSGYGTFQVDADGNLEWCYNDAGACVCQTVTPTASTIADQGDGTFDHDDGQGNVTSLDICAMVADGGCTDALVNNANGTYTHTALDGTVTVIDICAALSVIDTDCINLTLAATGTGCSIQADIILDPDACNGLVCNVNGLFLNNDIQTVSGQSIVASILTNIAAPGGLPAVPTAYGATGTLVVANPSACNPMSFTRSVSGSFSRFSNTCGIGTAQIVVDLEFSTVGPGGPWNGVETSFSTVAIGAEVTIPLPALDASFVQAVGGSNSLWVRRVFSNPDGNFCGFFTNGDVVITANGVNYIN